MTTTYPCQHLQAQLTGREWRCPECGHRWPDALVQDFKQQGWSDSAASELAAIYQESKQ